VAEIFGPESSGKTTLALHAVAEVQRRGGIAAFVDAERALDAAYAGAIGVDTGALLVSRPDHGEQGIEIAIALLHSGAVDLVVVDSVAALVPQAELRGGPDGLPGGLHARLMSQAMRRIAAFSARGRAIALFVNQVRQRPGPAFGETTPGGSALRFHAAVRLEIRRIGPIVRGGQAIGDRARGRVVKNKFAPLSTFEVDIFYGRGFT
jgi:recombination protein RecA